MTIEYNIATQSGLKSVTGESVLIPNKLGAKCGVHEEQYAPEGSPQKWSVSHIESGMAIAFGATRDEAIKAALLIVSAKGPRKLAAGIEQGMRIRRQIEAAEAEGRPWLGVASL